MNVRGCPGTPVALSRHGKESENPVLWPWPMTLKFSGFWAVVKVHVHAKLHQVECSGSWVIVVTEKKLRRKQYSPSLPRTVKTWSKRGLQQQKTTFVTVLLLLRLKLLLPLLRLLLRLWLWVYDYYCFQYLFNEPILPHLLQTSKFVTKRFTCFFIFPKHYKEKRVLLL